MSSKVVDERVVEMRFDNKDFEKNVSQSMNTLDKLKQKLKLEDATKGLNTIDTKANSIKFDKLVTSIDAINSKLTWSGYMVKAWAEQFATYLTSVGKNLIKNLSTDNIYAGWDKLQKKANSMSTLISQGYSTEVVEKQLAKLNWFSDETSYNFTDMIDNISKFTATGQGLEDSVTAMQGIALWAAKSGQNAQKASAAMYQLSQALGAGTMRKEDWKSIQNVSMDTQEFRKQAVQAAIELGTLKKVGNDTYQSLRGNKAKFNMSQFAENLTEGAWFTSDVMMSVYKKYAKASDQMNTAINKMTEDYDISLTAGQMIKAYDALKANTFDNFLKEEEIDDEKAIEALKKMVSEFDEFGISTFRAGQEYRTFNDAIDATKDAVSTKWMNIFETLIGNIDAQKKLWTAIGEKFYDWFAAPLDDLQELLNRWVDKGGRDSLHEALSNIGKAISAIVGPIKDAFREIFPPMTAKRLVELTNKFKDFTSKLIIGEKTSNAIKSIFKAFFSVLKTGITIVKTIASALFKLISVFKPLGVLLSDGITFLGKWIDKAATAARNSSWLANALDKVITAIKKFAQSIGDFFRKILSFESLINFFKSLFNLIKLVGYAIGKFIGGLVHSGDLNQLMKLVNSGLFSAALIKLGKMIDSVKSTFKSAEGFIKGFKKNTVGVLEQFRGILEQYQKSIKAKTIKQIAMAALILVGALWVLSGIDSDALAKALTAMAVAMGELLIAFKVMTKFTAEVDNIGKGSRALVKLSLSMLILAIAIKKLSSIDLDDMAVALAGLGLSLQIFIHAFKRLPTEKDDKKKTAGLLAMSLSILILATALKKLGNLSVEQIIKSLITMFVSLKILTNTINKTNPERVIGKAFAMSLLANALVILALALKILATMSWDQIARALVAMTGALGVLVMAINLLNNGNSKATAFAKVTSKGSLSKSTATSSGGVIGKSFALLGASFAMILLGSALKILATMNWSDIGRSLTVMAGSLAILVTAIKILGKDVKSSLAGAGTLFIVANSVIALGLALKLLATMSWESIAKSLVALAGALTVLGVAAAAFKYLGIDVTLLVIAGAFALFGVATMGIGAGLIMIATGITALSLALSGGVTAIVAGISAIIIGILGLIPEIIKAIGSAVLEICNVLIECAPAIAQALGTVLLEAVKMLSDFIPPIVTAALDLVIRTIRAVADRVPEIIVAIAELLSAIFKGFMDAFKILDTETLVGAIACLGMLAVIFGLLAGLAYEAPAAMIGVVLFGVLIGELIGVLSLLSAFVGSADAIYSAGDLLQAVGTAIGQLIGGIIGGIGKGVSDMLPTIGTNLSIFMENIKGFTEGLSLIDPLIVFGATALAAAILELTATNLIVGIVDLLSLGQHDLVALGKELSGFITEAKPFLEQIRLVSPNTAQSVGYLAQAILILTAANFLNGLSNLFSFITGGHSLSTFAMELPKLGEGLAGFEHNLGSFNNTEAVECAAKAIVQLAKAAQEIPNEGGLWAKIFGDNSIGKWSGYLPDLGTNLSQFATNLGSFTNNESIIAAGEAIVGLAHAASEIPNEGGLWAGLFGDNSISDFADKLPGVATHLAEMAECLSGFTPEDAEACRLAGEAIAGLAQAADEIPNSFGLVNLFTGDNDIAIFAWKLPGVGTNLASFAKNLGNFDKNSAERSKWAGEAIKMLAIAASEIPNEGGLAEFFAGDNDISNFAPKLPGVATNLSDFAKNLTKNGTFDEGTVKTVDCAGQALLSLSTAASKVPASGGVAQWFTGENDIAKFADKFPTVGNAIVSFVDSVTKNGTSTFDEGTVATVTCAGKAITQLAEAASNIPASGGIWQKLVGEKDLGDFSNDFPKVGKGIIGFVNALTNNGQKTFSTEQVSTVESASKALTALAGAAKALPEQGGFFSLFTGDEEDLEDFAEQFPAVAKGLRGFMNSLGTFSDKEVKSMEHATAAIKLMSDMYKIDWDELEDNSEDAEDVGENMGDFLKKLAKVDTSNAETARTNAEAIADVINTFSEQINGDNFHHISEGFVNFGKDFISSFVDSLSGTDPKTKIINAAQDLMLALKDALESERKYVEEKFTSLINGSIDKLNESGYIDKMKTAGKYAAQGFADGIDLNAYLASDAGTRLGNYAYEAAKKAIDAHSPSKKTRELGNFFGLGFIKGIKDYNEEVYHESESMADQASKGLTKAISTVNDIFNNNGTNRPVISPILDLSDVENRASQLNSLFGNVGLGYNLSAISNGMKQNRQNGVNDDVVNAINRLGSSLSNNSGDTYNINGITYNDDTNINNAVRDLVRAINVERRA